MISKFKTFVAYIKVRFGDKGTWAAIGVGVTGAAAVAAPYSYILIAVAVVGILTPTP